MAELKGQLKTISVLRENNVLSYEEGMHYHSYHLVSLILEGKGIIEIDGQDLHFSKGSIMLIPRNVIHTVKKYEVFVSETVIFSEDLLSYVPAEIRQVIDYNLLVRKAFRVFQAEKEAFDNLLSLYSVLAVEERYGNKTRFHKEVTASLFTAFIAQAIRAVRKDVNTDIGEDQTFSTFIRLVEENYKKHLRVSDYANMMAISTKTLERHISKMGYISPQKIISRKVVNEAKNLLRSSQAPVKTIAKMMGFCDLAHFTNYFKHNTGMTPTEFRNYCRPIRCVDMSK